MTLKLLFYSAKCFTRTTRSLSTVVKSYTDIPLQSQYQLDPPYLHEHCSRCHKELGPIYREGLGPLEMVFISDTKSIQHVLANEGQYPHHNVPESWLHYNKIHNVQRGLFFQTGEVWAKLRKVFSHVMLTPSNITKFSPQIWDINRDMLELWKNQASSLSGLVENVKFDLCKWSIETTGYMLFGNRIGCIPTSDSCEIDMESASSSSRADKLVESVATMFQETSKLQLLSSNLYHTTEAWNRFEEATTTMLQLANEYSQENIDKVKAADSHDSLLKLLLEHKTLSDDEISRSMVDLLIAAADTTSNALQWMLYILSKYPDVQERILEEVSLWSDGDYDQIKENVTYLRAFTKEVMRFYPTAPFLARTLDKDIELANYLVPSHTPLVFSLYVTSRMEEYFHEPDQFKPERWIRRNEKRDEPNQIRTNHAYASLPFGMGRRQCVGKRAAELEMIMFLGMFVRTFESSLLEEDLDIGIKLNMILCPEKPIRLKLKVRN